jgi:hypothetical protein
MMILYQFLSHLNTGPSMKKNQPAPHQKTNKDLHVQMWILFFLDLTVPYLILQSEINDLMRLQSIKNSGGTLGFSPTGMEFVTAR